MEKPIAQIIYYYYNIKKDLCSLICNSIHMIMSNKHLIEYTQI